MPIGNGGSGAAGGTGASPTGTGLYHVVAGVMVAAAALLVNADVAAGAALDVAKLAAGANTQVLTTVGGVPTWAAPAAGGAIGGLTTQVQYNLAGAFAGSTAMTFAASQLTLTSNLLAPGVDCNTAAVLTIGGANATTVAITVAAGSGGAQLTVGSSNCLWDTAAANPYWGQALTAVASATGQPMILGAQRATGVTSIGGKLSLRSGTGTSTNGAVGIGTTGFDAWTFAGLGSASALSLTADASMTSVTYTQAATSAASGATTSFLAQTSTFAGSTGGALVLGSGAGVTLPGTVSIKVGATTQAQLGLASTDFLALGAVVATTGAIRLGNALGINVRNFANSADVSMMSLNSSNNASFGDVSNAINTTVSASTAVVLSAGTEKIRAEAGGVSINGAGSYGGGVGVLCVKNATTVPSSTPVAAVVAYSEAQAMKARNAATTTLAPTTTGTVGGQRRIYDFLEGVVTTGATGATAILTFATATASSVSFFYRIIGRATAAGGGAVGDTFSFTGTYSVKNLAGTVALLGGSTISTHQDALTGAAVSVTLATNVVTFNVSGPTATQAMDWEIACWPEVN